MKSKRIVKTLSILMVSTMLFSGVQSLGLNGEYGNTVTAYADTIGQQTPGGIVSSKVKYDKITSTVLADLKANSVSVDPTSKPELFWIDPITSTQAFSPAKVNMTEKVFHWSYLNNAKQQVDYFYKVYDMENTPNAKTITKYISSIVFIDGVSQGIKNNSIVITDNTAYDYMATEVYTSTRLGGLNRYETALKIAKEYSSEKLNTVVLTSADNFPDALSGSVLADKYNAPILLVGADKTQNAQVIDYIKANLNAEGKIYILGGVSAVADSVVDTLKVQGFKNFERLGGLNRCDTNLEVNKELDVQKGTSVVIANSQVFADSLSVSSVASCKDMPIFLTDSDSISTTTLDAIKALAPTNIYIVGGTTAISSAIETQLKTIGGVDRIGGLNRYATSLEIAKFFKLDTDTVAISNGVTFPDALTGSVLASKYKAPILLVEDNVTAQKAYLDSTKISKIFVLGGTSAISDSIVSELKK